MDNVVEKDKDIWLRPWDKEKTDNIYDRDERFFSILMKGVIAWLNQNIILNGSGIQHYIFNTGSSYLYLESDGYSYSTCETSGEDQIYMKMPRCICTFGDISIPQEELSSQFVRGTYERYSEKDKSLKAYNAEIRRCPVEISLSCNYVLSTFNEALILSQELIDKIIFQRYFNIIYLGQKIMCSIEFPQSTHIEVNRIDLASPDNRQKTINLDLRICSNYPIINQETEIENTEVMGSFKYNMDLIKNDDTSDTVNKEYTEF
jgi:hypothetical protein